MYFEGVIIKLRYFHQEPEECILMLAECFEPDYAFQIIKLSGYQIGSLCGYIKKDPTIGEAKAVSKEHLIIELKRNFLNLEDSNIQVIDADKFAKTLIQAFIDIE